MTVRKSMNVYEMNINKIRSGNGSYWFSDGAKVTNVARIDNNRYAVYFNKEMVSLLK